MTDPVEEPKEPAPTILKFSDLRKMVTDLVDGAFASREQKPDPVEPTGQRRQPRREERPSSRSVDEEVDRALKKLEAEKAERAERDALKSDVEQLKEKTKERPPVEHRRVERIMGWTRE